MSLPAALMLTAFLFFGSSDDKPYLSDLQVSLEGTRVAVSFELVNAFGDELFERIRTGLASGFSFQFVLVREQRRWFDDKIDSSTLQVIAMYNAVTREYLINYKQDGKLTDSRVTRTRLELEQAMTRFEKLTVFHVDEVKPSPRRRALVRARAELGSKTMLLIIPTRVQTDWVKSEKFSLPSSQP